MSTVPNEVYIRGWKPTVHTTYEERVHGRPFRDYPTFDPEPAGPAGDMSGAKMADELITPYNTDEFYQLVNNITNHHQTLATQTESIAVDLRKLLANPVGTKFAMARVDLKINARRVARPIAHAAALDIAAAKAWRVAWRKYLELYANAPQGGRGKSFQV